MIVVDLKTKVLPQSHRIYMIRPGAAYHLLTAFSENSAVAPDLADLTIPDGERPRDFKGIDDQIKRARILAQWVKTEETRNAATPPTLIDEYKDMETPARVAMYRNTADEILHGLPGGSLIYLPNPDFTKNAIFGELADAKSPRIVFNGKGYRANFTYLGRPLTNVKQIPMQKLPKEFYPPMKRRNWIHEFEARETELMYRQYYGDFEIIGRKSVTEIAVTKSKVFAPDLSIVGAVTNLVDQTLRRLENNDTDRLSLLDAVFLAPEGDGPVIHANLGSMGEILLESARRHVAPVVKVLLVMAVAYTGYEIYDMVAANGLHLANSQGIEGVGAEALAETEKLTYDFVRATGRENLNDIVDRVRDFHNRTGGHVDATITTRE